MNICKIHLLKAEFLAKFVKPLVAGGELHGGGPIPLPPPLTAPQGIAPLAPPPAPTRPIKLPAPRPSKEATVIKTPVVPEGSYKALTDAPEPSGEVLSDSDLILVHDEDE